MGGSIVSKGRIVFYYESIGIGGAQLLLARIAEKLHKSGMNVSYICSENGFLNIQLRNEGIEFINIDDISSSSFSSDDIIVSPLSYIKKINNLGIINRYVRVFLWDIHPYNYIEYTLFSYFYKRKSRLSKIFKYSEVALIHKYSKNLERLQRANSVGFMCKKNFIYNQEFFASKIQKNYLPICLDIPNKSFRKKFLIKNEISIGWLSRLDYDKVILLNDFINSFNNISNFRGLTFKIVVIGSGNAISKIEKTSKVNIEFAGEMSKENLDKFLLENIDCGFSVGTSALEFAKLSIPTFLVPGNDAISYYKNREKKYLPLSSVIEYDVAVENYHEDVVIDIETCIDLLLNQFEKQSLESYCYVMNNHSISNTCELLNEYFSKANLSLAQLDMCYREGTLFKIFIFFKKLGRKVFT